MRWVFAALGLLFVGLAVLGVILPVLPTTPFLLVACYCFTKGSVRLSAWFSETTLYKRYIAEYMVTKALTVKQKWSILCMSNTVMLVSFLLVSHWAPRFVLVVCMAAANYMIIKRVRTLRPEKSVQQLRKEATVPKQKARAS